MKPDISGATKSGHFNLPRTDLGLFRGWEMSMSSISNELYKQDSPYTTNVSGHGRERHGIDSEA